MINISKKSQCCGCYGCTNVCPKQCIDMKIDNEGFWYPKVDKEICIECGLCEKVCPVINTPQKEEFNSVAYACKNKNEEVRLSSSSGGVFTNLCEYTIENGGVVFGAAFDENFNVKHMEAKTLEECEKFRGSKYVQSKIGETYKNAKRYLDEGKLVLFSGTQCQIKGLNLFLRKKYNNLIVVDIVCHGVPSPLVFDMYKENLKRKYKSEIKYISFRDKCKGWKTFSYVTDFKNGRKHSKLLNEDKYMIGFLKNLYLRPSCYNCKAKNFKSDSDISLADYWGVQSKHLEFDDDKGISLVLINSKKGQAVFNEISSNMEVFKTDLDYAISCNPCIIKSVNENDKRRVFFKKIDDRNLEQLIDRYTRITLNQKIKNKVRYELSKVKRKIVSNIN